MNYLQRKIFSVALLLPGLVYSFFYFTKNQALAISVLSLIPIFLIWFASALGGFQGYIPRAGNINTKTHPIIVESIGWIMLIGLLVRILSK